jgi:hypothetical protein
MQVEEEVEQLVMKSLQLQEQVEQGVVVEVHLVMELLLLNQLVLPFQEQLTQEVEVEVVVKTIQAKQKVDQEDQVLLLLEQKVQLLDLVQLQELTRLQKFVDKML